MRQSQNLGSTLKRHYDFAGYATKADVKCTDGAIIKPEAFVHQNGSTVPLVWQHLSEDHNNVLGHVDLEARPDGVYAYASFNDTPQGRNAKELVRHGDIRNLSIFARKVARRGADVVHGLITEVSLVYGGANPGAYIEKVNLVHGDDVIPIDDEIIIHTGVPFSIGEAEIFNGTQEIVEETVTHQDSTPEEESAPEKSVDADEAESTEQIEHADKPIGDDTDKKEEAKMADTKDKTVGDIFDELSEEQKNVVYYMIGEAIKDAEADGADDDDEDDVKHYDQKDTFTMTRNVFETLTGAAASSQGTATLSHADQEAIFEDAKRSGSFKEAVLRHAATYGIENVELLFPDAKSIASRPEFVARRTDWVNDILTKSHHIPFSRIKTVFADITEDEARAKGYIKGALKKDEFFSLIRRITLPQTIYKKNALDRDDAVDITDFDVVAWLREEMRIMLDEEIAAAALVGDGRPTSDPDKIKSPAPEVDGPGIRAIAFDNAFYAPTLEVDPDDDFVDAVVLAMVDYEGSGSPTLYTSPQQVAKMLLQKDTLGRRLYGSRQDLAASMGIGEIRDIPASILARGNKAGKPLLGIVVNMQDYTFGAEAGGKTTAFEQFDIDYNKQKYLLEGRCSGTLTKYKSALVIRAASVTP